MKCLQLTKKKSNILRQILFWSLLTGVMTSGYSQTQPKKEGLTSRILIIFDASGSMNAQFSQTDRMTAAKEMLYKLVDSLSTFDNVQLALRIFGHQSDLRAKDCNDTRLEVPFSPYNHEAIKKRVSILKPRGYTPIARSLAQSAQDFPEASNVRNLIILITDGIEECGGNPCEVSAELQKKGIFLKPFIIGVGSDPEVFRKFFSCVGNYYDANSMEEFETVIGVVISQSLNATSCQISLLDAQQKPMETNVNMSIYDYTTNQELFNYYHTLNARGVPDTLYLDPMRKYTIRVHTLPETMIENVSLIPGKHNTIAINAGQGYLHLLVDGTSKYDKLQAIIRKKDGHKTIHVQDFNQNKKYLIGMYDLEILTLPRIMLKDIQISQDKTTKIQIPQSGVAHITKTKDYVAAIFRIAEGKTEWVADIDEKKNSQELVLQPGNYFISGRLRSETKTIYTFQKDFTIISGKVIEVRF